VREIWDKVERERPLLPTTQAEKEQLAIGVVASMTVGAIIGGAVGGPPGAAAGSAKSGLDAAVVGVTGLALYHQLVRKRAAKPLIAAEEGRYGQERRDCIAKYGPPYNVHTGR
jgi:outer membrane lipoprotein SlyB